MLEVFRRLGSIQFDPLAVAGRSHDLVLHARVAGYDPAWCDLLYERREIFEAYNKGLSLVLIERVPVVPRDVELGTRRAPRRERAKSPSACSSASAPTGRCRRSTSSASAGRRPTGSGCRRTPCAPCSRRTPSRACSVSRDATATDATTTSSSGCCRPTCSRARSRSRSNSATSSCRGTARTAFSASAAAETSSAASARRSRTRAGRSIRANRTARGAHRRRRARSGRGRGRAREALRAPRGGRAARAPAGAAALRRVPPAVRSVGLGPGLLGSLFEFDYVWELFVPPAKRRWGWYVLPMLFRDRFVGRIEPRIDRDGGRVQVLGLWWEDGFAPRRAEGFVDAMRDALRAYLRFAGATASSGRRTSRRRSDCFSRAPRAPLRRASRLRAADVRSCTSVRDQSKPNSGGRTTTTVGGPQREHGKVRRLPALEPVEAAASGEESRG